MFKFTNIITNNYYETGSVKSNNNNSWLSRNGSTNSWLEPT